MQDMFWHLFMISLFKLGSIYWRIRVMYFKYSRILRNWLKRNMVDLLSVWGLIMVDNMSIDSFKNICCSQVLLNRGMYLTLLNKVVLLNESRGLLWRLLYVSCRQKTYWQGFGFNIFTVQATYYTRFWWGKFVMWLLLKSGMVRKPLSTTLEPLDVFLRHKF